MDFGLYLHHNAAELIARGTGPYFYLPKLENRFEARLWARVIEHAERLRGLPRGTVKVTVLHRDDHGRLRDRRDPARTPGLDRRAQLRPLGLHLQLHQEIRPPAGLRAAATAAA